MKKLYRVELVYNQVVLAESVEDAEAIGRYHLEKGDPDRVHTNIVKTLEDIPYPWDGECFPYSSERNAGRTIKEMLESQLEIE